MPTQKYSDPIDVDPDFYTLEKSYDNGDWQSDTTSIATEIAKGRMENGRRYQALKSEDYWSPSDEQQFEAYETGHLVALVLDYHQPNLLHHAPIGDSPKQILDVGTGKGSWAIDAADMYPTATVHGVDLFPPPVTWMPPNCVFEVDDLLRPWTWTEKFDFVYMRHMLGSFDVEGWETLYKRCYDNIQPGGWIEELEFDIEVRTDDNSLPKDSILGQWAEVFGGASERAGRSLMVQDKMRGRIEKAGFIDVHEHVYKVPIGPWPKDKVLKDAGNLNLAHWLTGMEGYGMWLLTKFGAPHPWTKEEVQVFLAKARVELKNPHIHGYEIGRRVWARKPFDHELKKNPAEKESGKETTEKETAEKETVVDTVERDVAVKAEPASP
ncbi:hypothetical protein N7495_008050 [Penicillium taxi]|uniref:uncharacterized protein n=1 Tax=Penicillium taxi TaxID=168475 RepID=UPI0025452522|nr:uncharacterized protein N7495_008050 [Penicillium taxi]KAJ5888009.1 hypothetical protein N7495_008050 [Penicillium taxi]